MERLTQNKDGFLYRMDGTEVRYECRVGLLETIKVKKPVVDLGSIVNELAKSSPLTIPLGANAYVISEWNCDTQFVKDGKVYSCYALQFYSVA